MTATKTTAAPKDAQPEHVSLAAALAAFQRELPRVGKDNTAKVTPKEGGSGYSYRYADLSEISPVVLPMLAKHGLTWSTWPTVDEQGRFVLRYILRHTCGEAMEGVYPLPNPASSSQVLGSGITYARRYALCAVTGVAPGGDDDDAAATTAQQHQREQRRQPAGNGKAEKQQPAQAAALDLLRVTCGENQWSLARVAALYAETHGGADVRQAPMRDIEEFRQSLYSYSDRDLRAAPPAEEPAADEPDAEEPA